MDMKKIFLYCTAIILISCSSSKKADNDYPLWVKQTISNFEKDNARAQIIQYSYNDKTVYLVSNCYHCPDAMDIVYDKDNNKVCEFGGIAGRNTCPDFDQKATNKKIVWQNKNFQYQ